MELSNGENHPREAPGQAHQQRGRQGHGNRRAIETRDALRLRTDSFLSAPLRLGKNSSAAKNNGLCRVQRQDRVTNPGGVRCRVVLLRKFLLCSIASSNVELRPNLAPSG